MHQSIKHVAEKALEVVLGEKAEEVGAGIVVQHASRIVFEAGLMTS